MIDETYDDDGDEKMTDKQLYFICNAVKCVALIAGITVVVCTFKKSSLMWFYLLVLGFASDTRSEITRNSNKEPQNG